MEILCSCNSLFSLAISPLKLSAAKQYINDYGKYDSQCPKCGYYYYYNPLHENEMFDLREMNTIW